MNFMYFHNSSTRNCDHCIFLIMTGNAHKESCLKLLFILVMKQRLYLFKTDCSDQIGGCFHNYRNKLFNGKPILPIGAAAFLFIFVALSS